MMGKGSPKISRPRPDPVTALADPGVASWDADF